MAKILKNLESYPYYDNTQNESEKGYVQVLGVPNTTFQNRELTTATGLVYSNLKKITNLLINNGSIVSGCNFYFNKSTSKFVLEEGQLYIEGFVVKVDKTEWLFDPSDENKNEVPTGKVYLCAELLKEIITEAEDPTLANPAENYEGYGEPGSHRLRLIVVPRIFSESSYASISASNKAIVDILKFEVKSKITTTTSGTTETPVVITPDDFEISIPQQNQSKPVLGEINKQMAKRMYDDSGDFIAEGLLVKSEANREYGRNKYNIIITSGRAYVKGFEVSFNQDVFIPVKGPVDYKSTGSIPESRTFKNSIDEYVLYHKFVKEVETVYGPVEQKNIPMVASSVSLYDVIPSEYYPILSVSEIKQGTTVYQINQDYVIDGNQRILWVGSTKPVANSTYYINIIRNKIFTPGVDYQLVKGSNNEYSIKFISDRPLDNRDFYIDYSWYLGRFDSVFINSSGELKVYNGLPGEDYEIYPPDVPIDALPLGKIKVLPGIDPKNYEIISSGIYRTPVTVIHQIKNRLDTLENNFVMTTLERETKDLHISSVNESLYSLKGIFAESFGNFEKADIYHQQFKCTLDVVSQELKLPLTVNTIGSDKILFKDKKGIVKESNSVLTTKYTDDIIADWQRYASDVIDINPYLQVKKVVGLSITPNKTVYYDSSNPDEKLIYEPTRLLYSNTTISQLTGYNKKSLSSELETSSNEKSGTVINELKNISLPYIKSLEVVLEGKNYPPKTEVSFMIEDVRMYVEPYPGTQTTVGTTSGNIITDLKGEFKVRGILPSNIPTGIRTIKTTTISSNKNFNNILGFTTFEGLSYFKDLDKITSGKKSSINIDKYVQYHESYYNQDPIAQSFGFNEDTFLTGIDLFFSGIPTEDNTYCYFMIKEMKDGLPIGNIIYQTIIPKSMISTSTKADKATKIKFDRIVYVEKNKEYAFILGSEVSGFKLWYSKLNGRDVNSGDNISTQPHSGVMFTSSNYGSWSPLQDSDITFVLYRAQFEENETFISEAFDSGIGNFYMFNSSLEYAKFESTDIKLYYGINIKDINNDNEWKLLQPNELYTITNIPEYSLGMKMRIKIVLETNSNRISPIIILDTLAIDFAKYNNIGKYITKAISI